MSRYRSEFALRRAKAAERRSHLDLIRNGIDRQQLVHRIGEVVRTALPPGAALILVGEGNDGSIELGDRRGLRFPQPEDAGPERLLGEGAQGSVEVPWIEKGESYEFLLYTGTGREDPLAAVRVVRDGEAPPETASRWLEHYGGFGEYLRTNTTLSTSGRTPASSSFSLRHSHGKRHKGGTIRWLLLRNRLR